MNLVRLRQGKQAPQAVPDRRERRRVGHSSPTPAKITPPGARPRRDQAREEAPCPTRKPSTACSAGAASARSAAAASSPSPAVYRRPHHLLLRRRRRRRLENDRRRHLLAPRLRRLLHHLLRRRPRRRPVRLQRPLRRHGRDHHPDRRLPRRRRLQAAPTPAAPGPTSACATPATSARSASTPRTPTPSGSPPSATPSAPTTSAASSRATDGGARPGATSSSSPTRPAPSTSALDETNPRILYAAVWEAHRSFWQISSGGPDSGLWRSTDGGETWENLTPRRNLPAGTLGKIGVAASPAQPGRVWALDRARQGGRSLPLRRLRRQVGEGLRQPEPVSRAWYYIHITADPQDPDTVYVNNLDFWKSTDGGKTFQRIETHKRFMLAAFTTSCLFLVSYLTYHFQIGSKSFEGQGFIRPIYFAVLLSHTILAASIVPLVIMTLRRAWNGSFERHARIARRTLPLWLYVSVTGVVVYWMLYQM